MERKEKQMGLAEGKDSENGHPHQCRFSVTLLLLGGWLSQLLGSIKHWNAVLNSGQHNVDYAVFLSVVLYLVNFLTHILQCGNFRNSSNERVKKANQICTGFQYMFMCTMANNSFFAKILGLTFFLNLICLN